MHSSILELDMSTDANRGFSVNSKTMANSVNPDEMTRLDLHCLQKYLYWSSRLKGLR